MAFNSTNPVGVGSHGSLQRQTRAALASLAIVAPIVAAAADGPAAPAPAGKVKPVTLEAIAGSPVKRITLTAKAVERLDIQTGKVSEEVVIRKQMVSGMVVYPQAGAVRPEAGSGGGGFGSFGGSAATEPPRDASPLKRVATTPNPGAPSIVLVSLSPGEFERIAKDKPARITPLYSREKTSKEMLATLSGEPPLEDAKRSMLTLQYQLPSSEHGLPASTRMRVELQLHGPEEPQRVVPYSSVYYDAKGAPWVYVNTKPLTYERQRITVARVVGNRAVISDGPAVGTPVVTVGASLLFGTEIFGK